MVRRLTGGGAILHDLELTYSIALPMGHELLREGANRLYALAHDAVIAALGELRLKTARCGESDESGAARGPFFCFERRHCYDVLLGGDKIAGSAQRRTRHGVLQHGSIVLGNRFAQQPTAVAHGASSVSETLEKIAAMGPVFAVQIERVFGTALNELGWTESEGKLASTLIEKYKGKEWTRRT